MCCLNPAFAAVPVQSGKDGVESVAKAEYRIDIRQCLHGQAWRVQAACPDMRWMQYW